MLMELASLVPDEAETLRAKAEEPGEKEGLLDENDLAENFVVAPEMTRDDVGVLVKIHRAPCDVSVSTTHPVLPVLFILIAAEVSVF
jgi:hypothetical protein